MTRNQRPTTLQSVSLRLHQGRTSLTWAVIYRTTKGDQYFDRRVSSGMLDHPPALVGPSTVCEALEAALADMRRRHGLPVAEGGSGAPGGGGGRPVPVTPGDASTVPLSVVRDDH